MVLRDDVRAAVAVVAKIFEQNGYFAVGLIVEGAFVKFKCVVEGRKASMARNSQYLLRKGTREVRLAPFIGGQPKGSDAAETGVGILLLFDTFQRGGVYSTLEVSRLQHALEV